jgi:hypothetical protein
VKDLGKGFRSNEMVSFLVTSSQVNFLTHFLDTEFHRIEIQIFLLAMECMPSYHKQPYPRP